MTILFNLTDLLLLCCYYRVSNRCIQYLAAALGDLYGIRESLLTIRYIKAKIKAPILLMY